MRALIALLTIGVLYQTIGYGIRARTVCAMWWHAPAGDGLQYAEIASTLLSAKRFALHDLKPTWSRPPVYPLFLAYVVDKKVLPLEEHLIRATRWNGWLDASTALAVWLIAYRRRLFASGWMALVGVLACPLLILLQCYALSESLATLLTTLTILCAVFALDGRVLVWAALAGALGGLLMLTRTDGVTVIPPVLLGLCLATASRRRRALAIGLFAAAWMAVLSPWAYRNYRVFGQPHLLGAKWMAKDGTPMRTGPEEWMWTWERHASAGLMNLRMLSRTHLDLTLMPPDVIESPAERAAVIRALDHCNAVGVTKPVSDEFAKLARDRARHSPFEVFVKTPIGRMVDMWLDTIQEGDMPLNVAPFGLAQRSLFTRFDRRLYALALAGLALALLPGVGRRQWKLALLIAVAALTRTGVDGYTQAHVTQRYLVEVYPLLILLAAMSVELTARRLIALKALLTDGADRHADARHDAQNLGETSTKEHLP